ncbi:asparagine synthase (glutamine-hydrolyzing) [Pelagibacteraceae bacterium]|nr:asparagine synthase (glutamine-hydrolyzing) [Pelagibacteraceae bacterium]
MCGFYGVFSLNQNIKIKKNESIDLNHRGPDSTKIFFDKNFYGKFFRLKILGNNQSNQPMKSYDGRWVIMLNGEIYNYKELAKELGEINLIKYGDTRVLTELIAKKGIKSLKKLNGMFAIVIYDIVKKKIYLARDRFGIKPIYYSKIDNNLFFSSEIKSISKIIKPTISKKSVEDYILSELYPKCPNTFFEKIYEVKPSTICEYNNDKFLEYKYFDLEESVSKINNNISLDYIDHLLTNSIKLRFRSNLPVNLHFSGGIDSTALLVKIKEIYGDEMPINLFCAKFSNNKNQDFYKAKNIAKFFNEKLNYKNINIKKIPQFAKKVQYFLDEPYGGIPLISMFQLNQYEKKRNHIVTLEGQGGDELFSGYNSHMLMAYYDLYLSNKDKNLQNKILKYLNLSKKNALIKSKKLIENNFGGSTDLTSFQNSNFTIKKKDSWLKTIEYFNILHNKIPRTLRFHDRVSAANSRELRFPYLDHNFVINSLALKPNLKFLDGFPKYPLRKIIKSRLDKKYIYKNKNSINVPQKEILNKNLKKWTIENLKNIDSLQKGHYKKIFLKKDISKNNSFSLWQKINLNIFFKSLIKINANLRDFSTLNNKRL